MPETFNSSFFPRLTDSHKYKRVDVSDTRIGSPQQGTIEAFTLSSLLLLLLLDHPIQVLITTGDTVLVFITMQDSFRFLNHSFVHSFIYG